MKTYFSPSITVLWDAPRCIHSGHCLRLLPSVFDSRARPWIDLDGAEADEVAEAINACPSGALPVPEPRPTESHRPSGSHPVESPDQATGEHRS